MKHDLFIRTIIILLCLIATVLLYKKEATRIAITTEDFITKWFKNNNGTFATYMQDTEPIDEDLVKGREALSETLGFWMEYAIEKNDQALFDESYHILTKYFLEEDGFIYWNIMESGESEVYANALVDDLRVINALFQASAKWSVPTYESTAKRISDFLIRYNVYQNVLTDFYEKEYGGTSAKVTLSYIEPEVLTLLLEKKLLPESIYTNMMDILTHLPTTTSFFPKGYDMETEQHYFDHTINMVDQTFVAIYLTKINLSTKTIQNFIDKEIATHNAVYGQYDKETEKPVKTYESPALYGLLIIYYLELNETVMAKKMYDLMVVFKSQYGKYQGGYSVHQNNTHIFDNIVPLLAESKLINAGVVELKP